MNTCGFAVLAALAPLAVLGFPAMTMAETGSRLYALDIPPRLQWEGNYGYCGEVSFISAGLYYGQYVSQYEARAIASPDIAQTDVGSQLIVGRNDADAATAMRLTYDLPDAAAQATAPAFLAWVRDELAAGVPVVVGVYSNSARFYGADDPDFGDEDYDHIVTVTGYLDADSGSDGFDANDRIMFDDHGLWTGNDGQPPFLFDVPLDGFIKTRRAANMPESGVYALKDGGNYGIALTGVADDDGMTVPVRVLTDRNDESPPILDGSAQRPAADLVTLRVILSDLVPGVSYNLYRYDTVRDIPTGAFNAQADKAAQRWPVQIASGHRYEMSLVIRSDETAAFRAVPADAP